METILAEECLTRSFLTKTLIPLENDEVFLAFLAARKKYCPTLSHSYEIISRLVIRESNVEEILKKLRRMALVGDYTDLGQPIPTNSFALYIDLNPKSTLRAIRLFKHEVDAQLYTAIVSRVPDYNYFKKVDVKLFSALHRSDAPRHPFWCIDMDQKDLSILHDTLNFVEKENVAWISETHGGYHLIIKRNEATGKKLFGKGLPKNLKGKAEVKKEATTPVPGTLQGGLLVKPVEY